MKKIADNFCGYLNVDNDTFAYSVSNHIVTLLPAQSERTKRYEVLDRMRSRNIDLPEYLFGTCDNEIGIAMLRSDKFRSDSLGLNPSIQFGTPVIIKATGNSANFYGMLTQGWNFFHVITFWGGNINALCNPQIAVERQAFSEYLKKNNDGARKIKLRSWNDYTRSVDFEIDGEKATLTVSVLQTGGTNNSKNMESYNLGELNSFIRFSFENAQNFDKLVKYYKIAKSLVAILTKRNNIFFEVCLSQRNHKNQNFETGVCRILDNYENYSTLKCHTVIPIYNIFDCVPKLIHKIANDEVDPLLALLPENNKGADRISITNVQDLCTALEVAYDGSKKGKQKDSLVNDLKKEIKKTIVEFTKTHHEIDVYKETTINSSFKYLDYSLKQKIITMYNVQ